jgi:hypothetical protein
VSLLDLLALAGPLECCDSLLQVHSRDRFLSRTTLVIPNPNSAHPCPCPCVLLFRPKAPAPPKPLCCAPLQSPEHTSEPRYWTGRGLEIRPRRASFRWWGSPSLLLLSSVSPWYFTCCEQSNPTDLPSSRVGSISACPPGEQAAYLARWKMGILERIKEIEAEMARTQKNKATGCCLAFTAPTVQSLPLTACCLFISSFGGIVVL